MTPVFAARRRAEEFAALVEGTSTRELHDATYVDLLELVGALRGEPRVEARPEFTASLRERLMTAAATELATPATDRLALPPRRKSRDRRIAVAVSGFALIGATTSVAMAAQSALPGDALYPIKRALENAHTGVSVGEGQKGETLLANATGRLDEVSALSQGGDLEDAMAIADTLDVFADQASQASELLLADFARNGDQHSVAELRDFASSSLEQLTALEPLVPAEARDELYNAAQVLLQIDAAARRACPTCGGTGITRVPAIFAVSAGTGTTAVEGAAPNSQEAPSTGSSDGTDVPAVEGNALPPGSVLQAPADSDTSNTPSGPGTDESDDPLGTLTGGITGGTSSQPSVGPTLPPLGDPLGDNGTTLDDVTAPVTDPLKP